MIRLKSRIHYTNNILDDGKSESLQPYVDHQACIIKQKLLVESPSKPKQINHPKPSIPCKRRASVIQTEVEQNSTRVASNMKLDDDDSAFKESFEIQNWR